MSERTSNSTNKIAATQDQLNEMLSYYNGYLTYNTSEYVIARAKLAGATITFYKTQTVLFQEESSAREYNIWAKKYNLDLDIKETDSSVDYSKLNAIGSDEVGTGDYFGPIVVCATYVSSDNIEKLRKLGVKDSKLLTDKQMIPMALQISEIVPYSIVLLEPNRMNSLKGNYSNLNFLKAYLHNKVINSILKKLENVKYDAILIDEFTPKEKYFEYLSGQKEVIENVTLIKHGEKAHMSIAAASILARVAFLRELGKLSNKYGLELYKGAGREVDRCAISYVKMHGWDNLGEVAKLKFSNTDRIKEYFMNNPLPKSKVGHLYDK